MRSPQETSQAIAREFEAGLRSGFPLTGKQHSLELTDVRFETPPPPDDYNAQKQATMTGATWGYGVKASFVLKDAGGHVLDRSTVKIATIPAPTIRQTFIVRGKEYQVPVQRRLRAGVYTKINKIGQPVADFNLAKGRNFSVILDPVRSLFYLTFKNTRILAYPVLRDVFAMTDGEITHYIPAKLMEIQRIEANAEGIAPLQELWHAVMYDKELPVNPADLKHDLKQYFDGTKMDPALNQMTVNSDHAAVSSGLIAHAMGQVHAIYNDQADPTKKDNLAFARFLSVEDFLRERLESPKGFIGKIKLRLDRATKIADLNIGNQIGQSITNFYTSSSLAATPTQTNPIEFAEQAYKVTALGEGGIGSSQAIPDDARNLHPSQFGFIDPVRTPDNFNVGVDLRLALGVKKDGQRLTLTVKDKTGHLVTVHHDALFDKTVAPDKEQHTKSGQVRAFYKGRYVTVPVAQVDYWLPSEQAFTVSTAIVPFISSNHPQRNGMGAKMLTQALSLVHREAPIIGTPYQDMTIEGLIPKSPVGGTVKKIVDGVITIAGQDGQTHTVNYAHEFPLNGYSYLDTTLAVKAGDTVKAGQMLGDSNFTKGGKLAVGTNLNVAYLPLKGYNYEDGIVVTEQGASKLASHEMITESMELDGRIETSLEKYRSLFPGLMSLDHAAKLDSSGLVKKGAILNDGDFLIVAMKKKVETPESMILGKVHSTFAQPYKDISVHWHHSYPGTVTDVARTGNLIKVTIKAIAPLTLGDKIAGRFGNKGVVTHILRDDEAPHTADGRIPDVIMNSAGLISRMNNGQIFEVAAAKALQKLGVAHHVFPAFSEDSTYHQIKRLVDKSGIQLSEEMTDPATGQKLGKVMMGPQYILKLFKKADSSFSARSGGDYDIDLRPAKGGEEGAKAIGGLDLWALIAHGARGVLREASTSIKAEYNPEVWSALYRGAPLPDGKPTFTYEKMLGMLRGSGVNIKTEGNKLTLLPLTDRDTLALSKGPISNAKLVNTKPDPRTGLPFRPEPGGLFDEGVTGGLIGRQWSHITLPEPVVNPLFHKPVMAILGLKQAEFKSILQGDTAVAGHYGGDAIHHLLSQINPKTRLAEIKAQIGQTNSVQKRSDLFAQARYLTALDRHGMNPAEAYVVNHLPVLPPVMRPVYPREEDGTIVTADANHLYKAVILMGDQLKQHKALLGEGELTKKLRVGLIDAVAKLQGLDKETGLDTGRDQKGFLKILTGSTSAKEGYFQSKLLKRQQDLAARGVVIGDPKMGLDQLGIPEAMAWKLYRPLIVGQLHQNGYDLPSAADAIQQQQPHARNVLIDLMNKHPLIATRAPVLHKFGAMAFQPILNAPGNRSIKVNTLITKGFGMDFDGDSSINSVFLRVAIIDSQSRLCDSGISRKEADMSLIGSDLVRYRYGLVNLANFPRLEETRRDKGGTSFFDVPEGVEALTVRDGKTEWLPVKSFSIHRELEMVEVETSSSRTIHCSQDHSLVTVDEKLDYVKAVPAEGLTLPRLRQPIRQGEYELLSHYPLDKRPEPQYEVVDEAPLDFKFGYFNGIYIGDGWIDADPKITAVNLTNVSGEMITFLQREILPSLITNKDVHIYSHGKTHDFKGYECYSEKHVWRCATFKKYFADHIGHGADNKHLPDFWIQTPDSFRWGLLAGLIDTDGTVSVNKRDGHRKKPQWLMSYNTNSRRLAYEIVSLAHSLDLTASVSITQTPQGKEAYIVCFTQASILRCQSRLLLQTPSKVEALATFRPNETYQQNRYTPKLSTERLHELRKAIGAPRLRHKVTGEICVSQDKLPIAKEQNRLYRLVSDSMRLRSRGVIPYNNAIAIFQLDLPIFQNDPFWKKWKEMVLDDQIEWEVVTAIRPLPFITEAYDLTIPPAYTMVTESGLIIWDTVNIQIPVTPEGISDARGMFPSKNLFGPLNAQPIHTPAHETILGLNRITDLAGKKAIKRFRTAAEAKAAFARGEIRITDPIEIGV